MEQNGSVVEKGCLTLYYNNVSVFYTQFKLFIIAFVNISRNSELRE